MIPRKRPMRRRSAPTGFTRQTRALILDRDGWSCQIRLTPDCDGRPTMLVVAHHRLNRGLGGSTDPVTNSAANGVAACHDCNSAMETSARVARIARERGLKLPLGADPRSTAMQSPDGLWWWLRTDGTRKRIDMEETA